jgi:hypothetical protein
LRTEPQLAAGPPLARAAVDARPQRLVAPLVLTAVTVIGFVVGARAFKAFEAAGGRPEFYQPNFVPAVVLACGGGYRNVDAAEVPALTAFLQSQTDRFACDDLPRNPRELPLEATHVAWRYLIGTVGTYWRFGGPSWSSLSSLAGVFFAATMAAVYALARVFMGPLLGGAVAVAVLTSPLFLIELPHLRDLSKAPFMIAGFWLLARLAVEPSRRTYLLLSAALGLTLGVGLGFRDDVLVAVPAFACVLVGGGEPLRREWRVKGAAAAVAAGTFLIPAAPILGAYRSGGGASMPHLALLGLTAPFDGHLGLTNGGLYEWGFAYHDRLVEAMIVDHAIRVQRAAPPVHLYGREYDRAGGGYLAGVAATTPADVFTRPIASVLKVMELPGSTIDALPPPWTSGFAKRLLLIRAHVLAKLHRFWIWILVMALALVAARDVRAAAIASALVVYFSAYPAIQFDWRHVFHLEVIPLIALGGVAGELAGWLAGRIAIPWTRVALACATIVVAAAMLVWPPLWILRTIQDHRVKTRVGALVSDAAPWPALERTTADRGEPLLTIPDLIQPPPAALESVHAAYVDVRVGGADCAAPAVPLTLKYASSDPFFDFSRSMTVNLAAAGGAERLLFPVYYGHVDFRERGKHVWYRFVGMQIAEAMERCIGGIRRLRAAEAWPVLPAFFLPADWAMRRMYQQFE